MKHESQHESDEHKVVICPAMAAPVEGKQIYILFSLYQVEDIQGHLTLFDVPFSLPFVEGISVWRNAAVPVIWLERYLGLPEAASDRGQRYLVLRSELETKERITEMRVAIRTNREIKMIPVPESNTLVTSNGWINRERVKGVFEWEKGFIVVPETDQIFSGAFYTNA